MSVCLSVYWCVCVYCSHLQSREKNLNFNGIRIVNFESIQCVSLYFKMEQNNQATKPKINLTEFSLKYFEDPETTTNENGVKKRYLFMQTVQS